jgi:hypothetical protein
MLIEILLMSIAIYLLLGFAFVIPFIIKGVDKIDKSARGSSIGFRIIIIPGVIIFWIPLLKKWLKASKANHNE